MRTPEEAKRELFRTHWPILEDLLKSLKKSKTDEPLLGSSSDETLRKVYMREGYLLALEDFRGEINPDDTTIHYD